jgi:2'-5' RNA ligase
VDKPARRPRLFAGIELDDAVRAECATVALRLERHGFHARYEALEKLHITLAFLGNVDFDRVDDVERRFVDIAAETNAFTLTLDKLSAFPNERHPRIVYLGARDQGRAFRDLSTRARTAFAELGFTFESDAVAHVTLARAKKHERAHPLPLLDVTPIVLEVGELTLFESLPDVATTRYVARKREPLR